MPNCYPTQHVTQYPSSLHILQYLVHSKEESYDCCKQRALSFSWLILYSNRKGIQRSNYRRRSFWTTFVMNELAHILYCAAYVTCFINEGTLTTNRRLDVVSVVRLKGCRSTIRLGPPDPDRFRCMQDAARRLNVFRWILSYVQCSNEQCASTSFVDASAHSRPPSESYVVHHTHDLD